MGKRHVIVVGGGVIGVASAYELAHRGHQTTLLEGREAVALGTSYANGALLTPAMSDPWNAPGVHRQLAASLLDCESAMKLRICAIPSLLSWGVRFLRNSSARRHIAATRASFMLARYSVECLRELRANLLLDYDASASGTLKLFRDGRSIAGPLALAQELVPLGLRFEWLDRTSTLAREPALEAIRDQITGAIHFQDDELGDACKFSQALSGLLQTIGGTIRTGVKVNALLTAGDAVVGVESSAGPMTADAVVVAGGTATPRLVSNLSISLPIKPAKGYTVTVDVSRFDGRPSMPVIDDALHAALVPIGDRLRVAGTAEFAGEDLRIHPSRIEALLKFLAAVYPRLAARIDRSAAQVWAGLRPMSADGLPFIGPTRVRGLYVNAGHGHLGWTLAAGSARLLADMLMGVQPQIDPSPYRATR